MKHKHVFETPWVSSSF